MNRQDIILIISILILGGIFYLAILFSSTDKITKANVYYDNNIVKTIDLTTPTIEEYVIKGYNGDVVIEAGQNKIRVKDEVSPLHICSKQGWVRTSFESIVCLPNKVIIKIESSKQDIDAVVR